MANKLDPMDLKQILTLHMDGYSNRKIGSVLGISRNTVNTYMQLFAGSEYSFQELLSFDIASLSKLFSSSYETPPYNIMLYLYRLENHKKAPISDYIVAYFHSFVTLQRQNKQNC